MKFKVGERWLTLKEMRKRRDKILAKIKGDTEEPKFPGMWCEKCGSKGRFHKKGCPDKK